jgi:hypothetical protein
MVRWAFSFSGEALMGFQRKRKVYRLDFAGTEFDGLEVRVTGLTTGEYLELISLSGPTDSGDKEAEGMIRMFAKHLVSWNLEENGVAVPTTYEAVSENDFTMNTAIVNAWTAALTEVSDQTAKKSLPGESPLVASIPTEML